MLRIYLYSCYIERACLFFVGGDGMQTSGTVQLAFRLVKIMKYGFFIFENLTR